MEERSGDEKKQNNCRKLSDFHSQKENNEKEKNGEKIKRYSKQVCNLYIKELCHFQNDKLHEPQIKSNEKEHHKKSKKRFSLPDFTEGKEQKKNSKEKTYYNQLRKKQRKKSYNFTNKKTLKKETSEETSQKASCNTLKYSQKDSLKSIEKLKHIKISNFSPKKKKHEKNRELKCSTPDVKKLKHNHIYKHYHHKNQKSNDDRIKYSNFEFDIDLIKSRQKPIKINQVSQKFKIANDFNELNSKIFLYDKDICLKPMYISDEIEEEEIKKSLYCSKSENNLSDLVSPINDNKKNQNHAHKFQEFLGKGESKDQLISLITYFK